MAALVHFYDTLYNSRCNVRDRDYYQCDRGIRAVEYVWYK